MDELAEESGRIVDEDEAEVEDEEETMPTFSIGASDPCEDLLIVADMSKKSH